MKNRSYGRRDVLKLGAAGGLSLLAGPAGDAGAVGGQERPNIVFIILDDMGPYELSCLGHDKLETPNMDRMAAEGMRFTQCYAGAPVCAPARSTLMTGQHMGHTSVRGNPGGVSLLAEDVTVAEVLKKAGYATGGFGKWGVGDVATPGVPEEHGFDTFFGYYHQVHAHYYYTPYLWRNSEKVKFPENEGGKRGTFTQYPIFEEGMKFIRENQDGPFFCYMPWTIPHGPHRHFPEDDPAWQKFADKDWPHGAKVYASMVSMADRQVGCVLDLLDELDIADNTIVFLCSDNGATPYQNNFFQGAGPLRGFKKDLYEGGLRTFMIARWPGRIQAGSVSDLAWYFPDVMPTLAEIAGVSDHLPSDIDGMSVAPTLLGRPKRQEKHEYLYWEYREVANWRTLTYEEHLAQAVRMGDWKGIRQSREEDFQLYDQSQDIGETNDVAGSHPKVAQRIEGIATKAHEDPPSQEEPPPRPPEGRYM